jgi:hypothetical protein
MIKSTGAKALNTLLRALSSKLIVDTILKDRNRKASMHTDRPWTDLRVPILYS